MRFLNLKAMHLSLGCMLLAGAVLAAAPSLLIPQDRKTAHANAVTTTASPPPAKAAASYNYVDPSVCAQCHGKIAASYRATGMGRSLSLPGAANTLEDYKQNNLVHHDASELTYTMIERDGSYYQRRSEVGLDGQETNVLEEKIDYIIGSGNHARSYLHRNLDGTIAELPVSWYAEDDGHWGMSPGYAGKDQEDFRREIPGECLSCHDGFPRDGKFPNRARAGIAIFPRELATGIDCQRCHGPGGAHVRAAIAGAAPETIRAAIVNPAKLNRDRQMDVCMQCHLETSSGLRPNEILRYDRPMDSFRPGDSLGDFRLFFDRKTASGNQDRFEIDNAAYRLRMSACFRNSQMTCLTCHNPHQSYRSPTSEARYVAACRECHQTVVHKVALPADSSCTTCHMPKQRTDDVVHVVMTDHYIQREKPHGDLLAPKKEISGPAKDDAGIELYYPAQISPPAGELYLTAAEVMHGTGLENAVVKLRLLVAQNSPAAPEFYFELGQGYSRLGNQDEAVRWYGEALKHQPDFRPAVKQLSAMDIAAGRYGPAVDILRAAVAHPPADADLFTNLGNAYLHQGRLAQAQMELEKSLQFAPNQAEAQNLLGLIALRRKNTEEAETLFRSALRGQPDYAEAHNNLGNLLAGKHDYPQAEYHFKRATEIQPGYAEALRNYGLMLALRQEYSQATDELRAAVKADPGDAETHSDLADILAPQGQMEQAEQEYRAALRLNPRLADAQCSVANVVAAQGRLSEASQQFVLCLRLAPQNYQAHLGLGLILKSEGQIAQARLECEKAIQSSDPRIRSTAEDALKEMAPAER